MPRLAPDQRLLNAIKSNQVELVDFEYVRKDTGRSVDAAVYDLEQRHLITLGQGGQISITMAGERRRTLKSETSAEPVVAFQAPGGGHA
ncbi:hypothetical protein [Polymorphospora lycopeni]